MSKTVFILGAGFSADAHIPVQEAILNELSIKLRKRNYFSYVKDFYERAYNISPSELGKIPLEDAFTFIDRSILSAQEVSGFTMNEMFRIQSSLKKLISISLRDKLKDFVANKSFEQTRKDYQTFFNILVNKRIIDDDDPFSIVTLNWDTIPEYFINQIRGKKKNGKVEIDYTTYDYNFDSRTKREKKPSVLLKRLGYKNIKIEKLHGSINWGFCSSCERLFVKKYDLKTPPIIYQNDSSKCRHCLDAKLKRLIVTPTFVKDLNNTHLKMIWHNALMDIQESKRLVFIGYSFPLADFEFRYLLSKALACSKNKKRIKVLLHPSDKEIESESDERKKQYLYWKRNEVEERYKKYFSQYKLMINYGSAKEFITNESFLWD